MAWKPYDAEQYIDFDEVHRFCRTLAEDLPQWVSLETVGETPQGRPLLALTITARSGSSPASRPALWLDAGTHASEWTGISAVLFIISQWATGLKEGNQELQRWFQQNAVIIMPCISPDGVQAMHDGSPYLRSTLRPPPHERVRSGLEPCDIDGDKTVRMMRWKHPAGAFVKDDDWAPFLRPRTLDDDPSEAYMLCTEGEFINWDGQRWCRAPVAHGVDLNRNFPGSWRPFEFHGRHGGPFALSEPESRAVVDTFASHPHIACALTMHTYTGCILTQPYRDNSPLPKGDIELMEQLANDMAAGTDYDVIRVFPDFMYDKDKAVAGVWADTIATVFGVPGYTIELWNPIAFADVDVDDPLGFLMRPSPEKLQEFVRAFATDEHFQAWHPVDHPQLGEVEVGGVEYLRTIRNPPPSLLHDECRKALSMADRARRSLPQVEASVEVTALGEGTHRVRLTLENLGFLSTTGLERAADVGACPEVWAALTPDNTQTIDDPQRRGMDHLDGWGSVRTGPARNAIYAGLPLRGHRQFVDWTVHGAGTLRIHWQGGRGGEGVETVELP